MPLDFDPNHSAAVLIGTSRFPRDNELPAIPQVVANVIDFERILSDPAFVGLPLDHITRLLDPDSAAFAAEALAEVAQGTTDLLLIYYAGHGLVSRKAE